MIGQQEEGEKQDRRRRDARAVRVAPTTYPKVVCDHPKMQPTGLWCKTPRVSSSTTSIKSFVMPSLLCRENIGVSNASRMETVPAKQKDKQHTHQQLPAIFSDRAKRTRKPLARAIKSAYASVSRRPTRGAISRARLPFFATDVSWVMEVARKMNDVLASMSPWSK